MPAYFRRDKTVENRHESGAVAGLTRLPAVFDSYGVSFDLAGAFPVRRV